METIIACPECERKLVAPSEGAGMVRCPKCQGTWRLMPHEPAAPRHAGDTLTDQRLKELNDTFSDRRQSQGSTKEKQSTADQQYQAYLEFGADFNWD
jgi:ssDNA-binding Zn-finger/Zn-ribbon topoisomerase 1